MIFGQNLRLFFGTKCVAGATSCTFENTTEFEETSTKDTDTKSKEQKPKRNTFNITVEALVLKEDDATGYTMSAFLSQVISGSPTQFKFTETNGTQNRTQATQPDMTYSGTALINDLTIRAETDGMVKISCKMIGYGNVSKTYKLAS